MDILKRLVVFVVVTAAAVYLIVWSLDAFGFRNPVSALLVNWLGMSWVALVGQTAHFVFPPRYYEVKSFEGTGQLYECLGIRLFKSLVRRGPPDDLQSHPAVSKRQDGPSIATPRRRDAKSRDRPRVNFRADVIVQPLCLAARLVRRRRLGTVVQYPHQWLPHHASAL